MGILTDRQIRDENIVTPCEPNVKRPGIVSYGLTSYGYDARIGHKFRVFKPYPATVIDPKAFDERMLEAVDLTPRKGHVIEYSESDFYNYRCEICDRAAESRSVIDKYPCSLQPDHITIPPHSFALGETVETFHIPRDTLAVVVGKSTYARCGLIVNVTPLEPEWRGKVTVELSNTTPLPLKVYVGEGIMQVLFLRSDGHRADDRRDFESLRDYFTKSGVDVPRYRRDMATRSCETSYADKGGRYQGQTGVTPPTVDVAVCILCDGRGVNRDNQTCIQCDGVAVCKKCNGTRRSVDAHGNTIYCPCTYK